MDRHVYIGDNPNKNWIKIQETKLKQKYDEVRYIGNGYFKIGHRSAHGAQHLDQWGRIECEKQPSPFGLGHALCRCGVRIYGTSHEEVSDNFARHLESPELEQVAKRPPPPPDKNVHEAVHFRGSGPLTKQPKEDTNV